MTTMPLWLTKVGHFCQIIWTWLKGNWMLLVMGAVLVYGFISAKRKSANFDVLLKEFQNQQAQNAKELEELRKIQQDQIRKQQEINQKYHEVLAKIEKDYQEQMQALTAAKKQELLTVIARNHDDPAAMAAEINSLFGIPLMQNQP